MVEVVVRGIKGGGVARGELHGSPIFRTSVCMC
jgi:hypothetical protein